MPYTPIPQPPGVPYIGNTYNLDSEVPLRSIELLADNYGEIYRLITLGRSRVFISSFALADEVFNEDRFRKGISAGLKELRNGIHDGLFTANYPGEENWAIAHRILIPAFGPISIRGMFDEMYDIATQLALKWARDGPKAPITATDDFTRLTLDTIALCAMGARFNSFYHEELHPFVQSMVGLLSEAGERATRPALVNNLPTNANAKFWSDIGRLAKISRELVDERRNNPVDKKDLLNAMLLGRDSKTGKGMTDQSIIDNMITFLIAGHETTSGLLSFTFYFLLKHPHAYKKAQEEVDTVIGRRKITIEDLTKLPYLNAVLRETLRLRPTAPIISLEPHPEKNHEDPPTLGNGKYKLEKGESVAVILSKLHRDPTVYGDDADEFKPERMLDEHFNKLPKNAWKPFGNGMRGCIGRPFAWQEALLVLAMLLQCFNFQMDDPSYSLVLKQTLTIKPNNFRIRAILREGLDVTTLESALHASGPPPRTDIGRNLKLNDAGRTGNSSGPGKPMHIFYGSNSGTCEALARRLAEDATRYGFRAEVDTLDSAIQKVPTKELVVFISATYEGQPPDNAAHFFEWLRGLKGNELEGVKFATFGCGHHDWHETFYRIPKVINELTKEHGGERLCELGTADASSGDMFSNFDTWGESTLWPAVAGAFGTSEIAAGAKPSSIGVEISCGLRPATLGLQLSEALVIENKVLTAPNVPVKRLVRFKLPSEMTYQCGDYLAVLPVNPVNMVYKAMRRFGLPWDATLRIQKLSESSNSSLLPLDVPIGAFDLLSSYVELSQPASKRDVSTLAELATGDEETQAELKYLASSPSRFAQDIVEKRVSPLDLLIRYPQINISIGEYLTMVPPMRARQYSISSSPLSDPTECAITLSVLSGPSLSAATGEEGTEDTFFYGIASNFLASLKAGDRVHVNVRPSNTGFKPPADLKTPMIMACAGSGLAPFRGFMMERAEKIRGRRHSISEDEELAKAILYVGCRTKGKDDIHSAELEEWEKLGAVQVRWAYSRPDENDGTPAQHVNDRMEADQEELVELFDQGARIYVCGSTGVGNSVKNTVRDIYLSERKKRAAVGENISPTNVDVDVDDETASTSFFERLRAKQRFVTDVFT